MGLIQKLSRKLSGTRAETGVRTNTPSSTSTDRNGLQPMTSRDPLSNGVSQPTNGLNGRPPYNTQPSTASSNVSESVSIPSQLCDVVVHCATVLPRNNTNTSVDAQNGSNVNLNGRNDSGHEVPQQRNPQRDTIMPLHSEDSYQAGYEAGRLYRKPSVPSSLHSSRPSTGGMRNDTFHTPPCVNNGQWGQDSNWDQPRHHHSNPNMNLGHSHAGAFNQQQNGWHQSGPSSESSQGRRNTYRMESGAYDAGYRDAMAQLQRSLG